MCTRGIYQLKHIKLTFCDWGGFLFMCLNLKTIKNFQKEVRRELENFWSLIF